MSGKRSAPTYRKWDRDWRIAAAADVEWIHDATTFGLEITSAIPAIFADYATIVVPEEERDDRNTEAVIQILRGHTRKQKWWLGYLDTGPREFDFFPGAPRVSLYANWNYVLALAGPDEAQTWRKARYAWHGPGPDLIFPTDRSWLMSWLWDDDWRCVGGPEELITAFLAHPDLEARRVALGEDATPPGHIAM
jgi:hypothetical protein